MLEELILYKKYLELEYYTYSLLVKFPKVERFSLCSDLKNELNNGLRYVISYQKSKDVNYLKELDISLKVFITLIRVSYKCKYINNKNYKSFSYKVSIILKIMNGLMKYEESKD